GSVAHFAVHSDIATALFDDSVYRGQAEASALAGFFGGEERLKNTGENLLAHPTAGVGNCQTNVVARMRFGSVLAIVSVEMGTRNFESELSAAGHGVARIHNQVHNHLLELSGIGTKMDRAVACNDHEHDVFP